MLHRSNQAPYPKRVRELASGPSCVKPALTPMATGSPGAHFLSSQTGNRKRRCPDCSTQRMSTRPVPVPPQPTPSCSQRQLDTLAPEPGHCPLACVSAESCASGGRESCIWSPHSGFSPSSEHMRKHLAEDSGQESVGCGASWMPPTMPPGGPREMKSLLRAAMQAEQEQG